MGTPGSTPPAEPEGRPASDVPDAQNGDASPKADPETEPATEPKAGPHEDPVRYASGRGRVPGGKPEGGQPPEPGRTDLPISRPAKHPPDPIRPFLGKPVPWRRARDWGVLVLAMIISAVLLAACCAAGFAFYTSRGGI